MADLLATQPVETAVAKALHGSYLAEALADLVIDDVLTLFAQLMQCTSEITRRERNRDQQRD